MSITVVAIDVVVEDVTADVEVLVEDTVKVEVAVVTETGWLALTAFNRTSVHPSPVSVGTSTNTFGLWLSL